MSKDDKKEPVEVIVVDIWEDIPDTYDKLKLCRVDDPDCEACQ